MLCRFVFNRKHRLWRQKNDVAKNWDATYYIQMVNLTEMQCHFYLSMRRKSHFCIMETRAFGWEKWHLMIVGLSHLPITCFASVIGMHLVSESRTSTAFDFSEYLISECHIYIPFHAPCKSTSNPASIFDSIWPCMNLKLHYYSCMFHSPIFLLRLLTQNVNANSTVSLDFQFLFI